MDDAAVDCNLYHRHFDRFCEGTLPGTKFPSRAQGLEVLQRRRQARLGVSRLPFLEPLGAMREPFYEQKLMLRPLLLGTCVGALAAKSARPATVLARALQLHTQARFTVVLPSRPCDVS